MSYNFSAVVLGPPGHGKTTLVSTLVRKHLAEAENNVVFVHDPVFQFGAHGCHAYADAAAWRAAAELAAKDGKGMPRGAAIGGDAESITRLCIELGERVNTANDVRVKILLAYDEGSLIETSGSTFISSLDNQLEATRRHRGIGIVRNLQQPTQLMSRFWLMSTDAYILRCTTKQAKQLDDLLLLEPGELARAGVSRLPKFQYVHVRLGEGIVTEDL